MQKKWLYIVYQPYKWFFYLPFIAINTLLFGVLALLFSNLINKKVGSYIGGTVWSRVNAFFVPMIVKTEGEEHIQKNTSYIVISNHQSQYDIFLLYGWLGIDLKFVMKKELAKIPGLGFGAKSVGHIFMDRSNKRKALESINEAKRKLVNGTSVIIFPEGTRSNTGKMGSFKRGAFKLAFDIGLPILPVTVVNTRYILPHNSLNLLPGKVQLIVHKPIDTLKFSQENDEVLITQTREVIESGLSDQKQD